MILQSQILRKIFFKKCYTFPTGRLFISMVVKRILGEVRKEHCIINKKLNRIYMNKKLNREMGEFLGKYNWDLFSTLKYHNGCKEHFNRKVMENYYQRNKYLIKVMFFVSERDKNYTDVHSHILISTPFVSQLITRNNSLNKLGHIHNEEIDKNSFVTDEGILNVGIYVTKFYDKGVDWDIFI